jgi:hypothetical protein
MSYPIYKRYFLKAITISCLLIFLININVNAQVSISNTGATGEYFETFSGINTSAYSNGSNYTWNNNTTLQGWYISHNGTGSDFQHRSTLTTGVNTGKLYLFNNINSDGDKSIGFRASGTAPNNNLLIGLRIQNNTGVPISSIYIEYYGEQWTISQNGTNINKILFSYQQGASITSLTSGTWTNESGLDFTELYSSTCGSGISSVLNGNSIENRTKISACIEINIPDGEEIMFRWRDIDDGCNDHHFQIDDIKVRLYDLNCMSVLPISLIDFSLQKKPDNTFIQWATSSETNNDYFEIEHSVDGNLFKSFHKEKGAGNSNQIMHYNCYHNNPYNGINYYRLKQVDFDGNYTYSDIKAVNFDKIKSSSAYYSDNKLYIKSTEPLKNLQIEIFDTRGRIIYSNQINSENNFETLSLSENFENGMYIAVIKNEEFQNSIKFVVSK